jgi:radical SAM protein with 4Fe4S-binding SPASM domain
MTGKIKEGISIFRKITRKKIWNIVLLKSSFYISILLKKVFHWGNPFALSIEPTTSCNLRCPECPSGLRSLTRPTGMLDIHLYKQIIDQFEPFLTFLILYFQGEPYLNPDFFNLIQYASQRNIYTTTSTNAHFLNDKNAQQTIKSGLDKIIISIDGTDQEVYETYRVGGTYDKVIEGIQNLVYWRNRLNKKNPVIVLQFLVFKSNQHQIPHIKRLSKQLKADRLLLKTAQINNMQKGSSLIPDLPKYSRYKKVNGQFVVKNMLHYQCWRMWSSCVITWDGKVVPCCFDKDADYVLGDLKKSNFSEIWSNNDVTNFRNIILRSRKEMDMCRNCTNGSTIWAD